MHTQRDNVTEIGFISNLGCMHEWVLQAYQFHLLSFYLYSGVSEKQISQPDILQFLSLTLYLLCSPYLLSVYNVSSSCFSPLSFIFSSFTPTCTRPSPPTPHPYLSEQEVLLHLSLPLVLLLGVRGLLLDDQPSQRPRLLHRRRGGRGGWGCETLVLPEFLFCLLWVTLVLPGRPRGAGARSRDLITGLGHDLRNVKRRSGERWTGFK